MRAALLAVLLTILLPAWPAAAFVELSGELLAGEACEAFQSFRQRRNPDGARLEPGRRYQALGLNRKDGDWVQVLVPEAQPQQRWVAAGCGRIVGGPASAERGLRPFFDEVGGGRSDPSPPAPELDAFDRAVLETCGPWGSRPKPRAFRAMLDRPELAGDVERIYAALEGSVRDRAVGLRQFKDELTDAWFAAGGFVHVFCGEPEPDGLGGLHYRGRYLELQEQGLAGLMSEAECRGTEIEPPVYTVGVRYRLPGRDGWRTACPKGYPGDLGARDFLIEATRAFRAMRRTRGEAMCLHEVAGYTAVLVVRGGGVRTFYPDASPRCDGGRLARCACGD